MKYLYYCNSPYQLFNVINLNWHRKYNQFENINNYNADLYILDAFENANRVVDLLNKSEMFENVFICRRFRNNGMFHKINTFLDILFPKRFIKKTINENYQNYEYDVISIPKISKFALSMWALNKKATIYLHEEGVATYCGKKYMCGERGNHERIYSFFNGGRKLENSIQKIYINDFDLYLKYDNDVLVKIPSIDPKCLKYSFSCLENILENINNKKVYWFGQYVEDSINNITEKVLIKYKNDVIFFPHPRFKQEKKDFFDNSKSNSFLEMSLSTIEEINNKCFVTIHSTAVFSPKLLYDAEPYIIFTVNMTKDRYTNKDTLLTFDIIEKFKNTYSNPNKIMLPNNEDELVECINKYYSSIEV